MTTVKLRPAEMDRLRQAIAFGMLNLGHAIEGDAKADAPVRGGHRSFLTTKRTKAGRAGLAVSENNGSVLIGGNLRRSIHTAAYLDGSQIARSNDDNGKPTPNYAAGSGIKVFVGTNSGYGAYVELGTRRMAARPFLTPAFLKNRGRAASLIAAGARRKLGQ